MSTKLSAFALTSTPPLDRNFRDLGLAFRRSRRKVSFA